MHTSSIFCEKWYFNKSSSHVFHTFGFYHSHYTTNLLYNQEELKKPFQFGNKKMHQVFYTYLAHLLDA